MKIPSYKKLIKHFFVGALIVIPILLLVQIVTLLQEFITPIFLSYPVWLIVAFVLLSIPTFILVGFIFTYSIAGRLNSAFKRLLKPNSRLYQTYVSLEKIYDIVSGKEQIFKNPVWVMLDHDVIKVGFVTKKDMSGFNLKRHVTVFLPTPFSISGEMVVVSKDKLKVIENDAFEVLTLTLTGGMTAGAEENK